MKICVAQTRSVKGDILRNIDNHKEMIAVAASNAADIIVFPELSLTGYEPELAGDLAITQDDNRLNDFQKISNTDNIIIGIGVPTKSTIGILISMILFQPHKPVQTYSKQHLHKDELPYFACGEGDVFLSIGSNKISFAICYELSVPQHSANAQKNGADIYIASVAKSASGVDQAAKKLSNIAKENSMIVLMANCVGHCDNFESVGTSSVWNKNGVLVDKLDEQVEGFLIVDTDTGQTVKWENMHGD